MTTCMGGWRRLLLVGAVLAGGCGTKEDHGGEVLVPDLSATWRNQANTDDQFFFLVDEDRVRASSFTGNENDEGAQHFYSFAGSFADRAITFTYNADAGAKANQTYTGTIEGDSTKITLSGSGGKLVLSR